MIPPENAAGSPVDGAPPAGDGPAPAFSGTAAPAQRRAPPPPPSNRKPVRRFMLKHVLPPLVIGGYRMLGRWSWQHTIENGEILEGLLRDRRQVVGVFLHARLILLFYYFSQHGRWMFMTSQSRDGELLARLGEGLGFGVARGSSARGGARALVEMIKAQRADRELNAGLAIDGSRGPRGVAQPGVITIAQKTGALILPVCASTRDCWVWQKSWDRTVVPKARAAIRIRFGEPIAVPPTLDAAGAEALRLRVEQTLLRNHAELDAVTGFRDTEPLRVPSIAAPSAAAPSPPG